MTEEILVSVKGLHDSADSETGNDEIELFSPGKYYYKNGTHYVFYEEYVEETGEILRNRITLKGRRMEVNRKGSMNTTLIFEPGKKNESIYHTPYGAMPVATDVTKMKIDEKEDLLDICVEYDLDLNYEQIASCRIQIQVMSKESGLFRLR